MVKNVRKLTGIKIIENFLSSQKPSATAAKIILAILALGGIVFIGAVAPNMFSAFGRFGYANRFTKKQISDNIANLKRKGLVEIVNDKNNKTTIRLTTKGGKRVRTLALEELVVKKPLRWDGRWRIVIFDIPNVLSAARSAMRETLKDLGMLQLQKSVWVYPYSCEDEVLFVANFFGVENYIEIFETSYFMNESTEKILLGKFNP